MDYGMLGGLGAGLSSGVDAYQKERAYQQDVAFKKQKQQAGLPQQGMQQDDSGNVQYNTFEQAKRTPDSPESQRAQHTAKGLLKSFNPNVDTSFLDGMTAHEIENNGLIPKGLSAEGSAMGMMARAGAMQDRNQISRDSQSSQAANQIHNDKRIVNLTQQLDQLERGRRILDQPTITNQEFNDYQQEIQSAISGATGGAVGKLQRTEYTSLQGNLAALKQKITGKPQDAVPPELVERLRALADHTRDMMATHRSNRASSLFRQYPGNPQAETNQRQAIEGYRFEPNAPDTGEAGRRQGTPQMGGAQSTNAGQMSQQDQMAVQWAKQNPKDPRSAAILKANGM